MLVESEFMPDVKKFGMQWLFRILSYKPVKVMSVCVDVGVCPDVNQGGHIVTTAHRDPVIMHAQTY